ncbi:hypothetical protein RvY_11003 [Ramazzottius varieornatus]|uniref:Uncharacterized protein n=1 Tax=Ramazzottius varieornatus TaxID=947166 RepID=A0A1D1VEN0_RAMVA|nr:hypothetical protein RvY_11003 [Ramazzottius varieornatus]
MVYNVETKRELRGGSQDHSLAYCPRLIEHWTWAVFGRWIQLSGLYPRSLTLANQYPEGCPAPFNYFLLLWTLTLIGILLVAQVLANLAYLDSHAHQVVFLEFFTLVIFIHINTTFLLSAAVLALMIHKSRDLVRVVGDIIELYKSRPLSRKEYQARSRFQGVLVVLWYCLSMPGMLVATIFSHGHYTFSLSQIANLCIGVTSTKTCLHFPAWLLVTWDAVAVAIVYNSDFVQLYLMSALIFLVNAIASRLTQAVDASSLMQVKLQYRKIRSLMDAFNGVFSPFVFLSCVRMLINFVSLFGKLLQSIEQETGEPNDAFVSRRFSDTRGKLYHFTYSGLTIFNQIILVKLCLSCHEKVTLTLVLLTEPSLTFIQPKCFQVAQLRSTVRRLQANTDDEKTDAQCSALLNEICDTDLAVSGGGFFYIAKEYTTAVR